MHLQEFKIIWAVSIMGLYLTCTQTIGVRFSNGPPNMCLIEEEWDFASLTSKREGVRFTHQVPKR